MREGVRNFMVGLAAIIALVGLAFLLMSFGELDPLLHPRYKLTLKSDNAAGLRPGGTVEFNGVPVGVVDSVYMEQDPDHPVRVICLIDYKTRIPVDAKPFAAAPLIGGSAGLQLQAPANGEGAIGHYFPTDDTAEITGPIRGGMFAQLTEQLDQRMKPLSESLDRFNRLSDTYIALGNNLNNLLQPQSEHDLAAGEPPNLRTAVVRLNDALDQAREGLSLAKSFLGDEQMRADARSSVEKAKHLIEQATTAVEKYTRLADSLQANAEDLTKHLLPVSDSMAATLEDVRRLAKLASEGKGTMGLLLNSPDLYNSLNDTAVRLERTLVQIQTLVEKLKQEGVNIHF